MSLKSEPIYDSMFLDNNSNITTIKSIKNVFINGQVNHNRKLCSSELKDNLSLWCISSPFRKLIRKSWFELNNELNLQLKIPRIKLK